MTRYGIQTVTSNWNASDLFACKWLRAPATTNDEGLADAGAASPFRLPRNYPGSRFVGLAPARDATDYSIT
jgi:hypothetical protein